MALPNHATLNFVDFCVASNLWPTHINNFCILEDPCAAYICRVYIEWNTKKWNRWFVFWKAMAWLLEYNALKIGPNYYIVQ